MIDDLDFKKAREPLNCIILDNINYFLEKTKTINLGEDVETLGILRINYFDLKTRKEKQRFEYYLEVLDVQPKKSKTFNPSIMTTLKEKLKSDSIYFEKLIDAIHPLTYLIDIYYPMKLLNAISFITGGSWNTKDHIRDTLNIILAGTKTTFKSSIARSFETVIGKRHYLLFEVNKKVTAPGLIGTTQRDANKTTPTIRYGILLVYSNGTIVWDEAQKMSSEILDLFRCLEKGNTGGIQEALLFVGPARESITLIQNCVINKDGTYNHDFSLFTNLGWDDKNSESRLERFDLLYIIPSPDTFIKIGILNNERKLSRGVLLEEIANDLELKDYVFPKDIKTIQKKIEYLLYHYFHGAKEFYRKVELLEKEKEVLRKLYEEALQDKEDQFKTDTDINIRSLNICYKILKSLSSLRFIETVGPTSYNIFKKKCMKFILPFRNSELIDTKQIDMNEVFKETFKKITKDEVMIKEFIDEIRKYMKRIYYNDKSEEIFEEEIEDYINSEPTLKDNYEFKKLLKNNEKWLKDQGFFVEYGGKGKGHLTIIKRISALEEKTESKRIILCDEEEINGEGDVISRIEEIFKENQYKALEEKAIRQILDLKFSKDLIEKALDHLWDNKIINLDENNKNLIRFDKNKKKEVKELE